MAFQLRWHTFPRKLSVLTLLWQVVTRAVDQTLGNKQANGTATDASSGTDSMRILGDVQALTDDELVAFAQMRGARDERAFRELVRRHERTVWRVCYGFVDNPHDAEDLTQEVFVKAYRNLTRFEGRSSFKTWVYRIAINTSRNELRRRSRRPQSSSLTIDDAAEFLPSAESINDTLSQREERRLLALAFSQMRAVETEVLRLKDLEDYSYVEISEMLDISVSAAKMRVQRARLVLRDVYYEVAGLEKPNE